MTQDVPERPDFTHEVDLASRRLGGSVVAANDEFFAERENLIKPTAPVHQPSTFGHKGQVYDGWETRRHNTEPPRHGITSRRQNAELRQLQRTEQ